MIQHDSKVLTSKNEKIAKSCQQIEDCIIEIRKESEIENDCLKNSIKEILEIESIPELLKNPSVFIKNNPKLSFLLNDNDAVFLIDQVLQEI